MCLSTVLEYCGAELSLFPQTGTDGPSQGGLSWRGKGNMGWGSLTALSLRNLGIRNTCRDDTVYFKQLTKHYLKD